MWLTLAAENLGRADTMEACRLIIPLLKHPNRVVREGAVLGLEYYFAHTEVLEALKTALREETESETLKLMLREAVHNAETTLRELSL